MLIIVSGPESIPKLAIARSIYSALLSTIDYLDYKIGLDEYPFSISKNDEVLYSSKAGTAKFLAQEPNAKIFFSDICDIVTELASASDDWRDVFVDVLWDLGIKFNTDVSLNAWEEQVELGLMNKNPLDSLIESYRNKKYPIKVVVGSFSKHSIDELRNELGNENVTVINFIRHPQVDWLMSNQKYPEITGTATLENLDFLHNKQITNSCLLTRNNDITTLKFENVIKDGYFYINGVKVDLLEDYHSYNDYITVQEHQDFEDTLTDQERYDSYRSQLEDTLQLVQGPNSNDPRFQFLEDQTFRNFFTLTNYTPLTTTEITSK